MTTKVQIGTIIHATLRPQDLVPAFLDELKRLDKGAWESVLVHVTQTRIKSRGFLARGDNHPWWDSEDCAYLVNEVLFDALNEYAPVGCYFGAHPGDGSDFGFWPCEDLDDALMNEEVLHVGPKDTTPEFIMKTNDHGNVTMYRVQLVEEWSCV